LSDQVVGTLHKRLCSRSMGIDLDEVADNLVLKADGVWRAKRAEEASEMATTRLAVGASTVFAVPRGGVVSVETRPDKATTTIIGRFALSSPRDCAADAHRTVGFGTAT